MNEIVFTPASVLDLLSQIDELKDMEVSMIDVPGANIQFTIGSSTYTINTSSATDVRVSEDVVEDVSDVNTSAYSELQDDEYVEVSELTDVKSGLLKEIGKTLLVGGLVRLTNKLLGKDRDKG